MAQKGNTMITMVFTVGPADVSEGDRIFTSHAKWMEKTHHKDGELEMLSYNVAKGIEYVNPLDPSSKPTGNVIFSLCEVYKKPEGLADHWKQGQETWEDFNAMMSWATKGKLTVMHGVPIIHSLW